MCYYKLYHYAVCGHYHWGKFLAPCNYAATHSASSHRALRCAARQRHPYQTLRIHTLCSVCLAERERSLRIFELTAVGEPAPDVDRTLYYRNDRFLNLASPKRKSLGTLRDELKVKSVLDHARMWGRDPAEVDVSRFDGAQEKERSLSEKTAEDSQHPQDEVVAHHPALMAYSWIPPDEEAGEKAKKSAAEKSKFSDSSSSGSDEVESNSQQDESKA